MDGPRRSFYGWVIVALCFGFLLLAYLVWYSFSVFFVALLEEFGWPRADTAGAFSVFVVLHGVAGIFSGRVADRFGSRVVVAGGGLLLAAALLGCSRIAAPWQLYLFFGVGCAVGVGAMGWVPAVALLQRWFRQRLGLAVGLASSGIGVGIFIGGPAIQALITALGWRGAYLVLAAAALVVPPLALIFVRDAPEQIGQQPDGLTPRGDGAPSQDEARIVDRVWASRAWTLHTAARTWRLWLLVLCAGAGGYTQGAVFIHQVALLTGAGFERLFAASIVGVMGLVSVAAKVGWGVASDRLGREVVATLGAGCSLLGIALLVLADRLVVGWVAVAYGVVFALGYAVAAVLTTTATADVFAGRHFGAIYAVVYLGTNLGGSAGAWSAGLVFDRTASYDLALALAAAASVLTAVGVWLAAPRKVRLAPGRVRAKAAAGPR